MPTESIFHQVHIDTEEGAARLLAAMEEAVSLSEGSTPPVVPYVNSSKEDVQAMFGRNASCSE